MYGSFWCFFDFYKCGASISSSQYLLDVDVTFTYLCEMETFKLLVFTLFLSQWIDLCKKVSGMSDNLKSVSTKKINKKQSKCKCKMSFGRTLSIILKTPNWIISKTTRFSIYRKSKSRVDLQSNTTSNIFAEDTSLLSSFHGNKFGWALSITN